MTTYRDYTDEEIERRGEALYAERIRPLIEAENKGQHVVIDVETGEYLMGDDPSALSHALHAQHPEAPLYGLRVGYSYTARLGRHGSGPCA